jgi:hypothetical protein
MTSKSFYYCKACKKVIGWKFGASPQDEAYCFACEPAETHKEEIRQIEYTRYRAAMRA